MAVDVAVSPPAVRHAVATLRPAVALAGLVVLSAAVRLLLVLERATPRYFPDEYLYSELARSFADRGRLHVLGEPASLPSPLAPVVHAAAWLPGDPELAFRLTQGLHVLAMSLAAVPVYLLARRLGLGPGLALGPAAVAVASPDLLYAGYVTADAIGYTLALVALLAGVRALAKPTLAAQAWFVAATAAATAARIQYAVLVPCLLAAAVVVERGRVARALRSVWLVAALTLAGGLAVAAVGGAALGRYGSLGASVVSTEMLGWLPASAFLLALAAGAVLIPGAVAWLAAETTRPTRRDRTAFASFALLTVTAAASAAAVLAVHSGSERFFERYLMIAIPLVAVAFGCWLEAGRPARRLAVAVGILLLLAAARAPLADYAAGQGRADSPLLLAVGWLEGALDVGTASLTAAAAASLAVLAGLAASLGRRARPELAFGLTLAVLALVSAGAHAADRSLSHGVAADQLGGDPGWVDKSGLRDVMLVQTLGSEPSRAMSQAFWNESVTGGALLGAKTMAIDGARARLAVDEHGGLHLAGVVVRRPLLVAADRTRTVFAGAATVTRGRAFDLVRPHGAAHLAAVVEGLAWDGWLGARNQLVVYAPADAGTCRTASLRLTLPARERAVSLRVRGLDEVARIRVRPGRPAFLHVATRAGRARAVTLEAVGLRPAPLRARSVRAAVSVRGHDCRKTTVSRP
jgi:hypothetical protein